MMDSNGTAVHKLKLKFHTTLPDWAGPDTKMAIYETPNGDVSFVLADPEHEPLVLNYETGEWDKLNDPS